MSVLGRAAGFGAGDGTGQMCDAVNLARSFGVSLEDAMSSYVSFANLPAGCNFDGAVDQMCSDAGLACSDNFVVPTPITFASASSDDIMSYQQSLAEFADCWGDNGALRPLSNCVSSTDFSAMNETIATAETDIESAITSVQNQLRDAADAEDLNARLTALQSAQASVEVALPAVQRSMDNIQPSPPPAPPADLDGATVGTIVVASLIGVALVGGAIAVHLEL